MQNKSAFKFVIAAAYLLMMLITPKAYAEDIISAENPDAILNFAKRHGNAWLKKTSGGDPLIIGKIDGHKYDIYFHGCTGTDGTKCKEIEFVSSWRGVKVSMDQINEWNRTKNFGKVYLDEDKEPMIGMMVNLAYGVTEKNLKCTFIWWAILMKAFRYNFIDQ